MESSFQLVRPLLLPFEIVANRLGQAGTNWRHNTIRSACEVVLIIWCIRASLLQHFPGASFAELFGRLVNQPYETSKIGSIGWFAGLGLVVALELACRWADQYAQQAQQRITFRLQSQLGPSKHLHVQSVEAPLDADGHRQADNDAAAEARADDLVWREQQGVAVHVPRFYDSSPAVQRQARHDITKEELAQHNTKDNAWICVEGRVYDVTRYVDRHPGGWLAIADLAGKDVTDAFANYHPAIVYKTLLPTFYIGDLVDYSVPDFVKAHRQLRQDILKDNMYATEPSFYLHFFLWYIILAVSAGNLIIFSGTYWWKLVGGVILGLFWQQTAFLGHDIGHNAISHARRLDLWWGIVAANLSSGISMGWWKCSHNVHHVLCNAVEHDPTIQHLPIFAVDEKFFGGFFSSWKQKQVETGAVARFLVSYQHILFYPVMAVARFNLYVQSYKWLLTAKRVDHRLLELATMLINACWMVAMVAFCFDNWQQRLLFLVVSHAVAGILHVQICLSHFAEDTYRGNAYNDESDEWFRMQVKTTLNVDCPTWMDWFHGGLQFQLEHHLFPRLPRHNLRRCRDMVKAFCAEHGVEYKELDFINSNRRVLSCMYDAAQVARTLVKGDAGFYECPLHNGFNAIG